MGENNRPRIVGTYIRQRRESLNLSQRALGLLFTPAVTTQFISNVERGVTPLPPAHVTTLAKALQISEVQLLELLEREYAAKLSGRLGKDSNQIPIDHINGSATITVQTPDYSFMRSLYDAYARADSKTRDAFLEACTSLLNLPRA